MVANAGGGQKDSRLVVMTDGGAGVMEASSRGAHETGAKNIGLNITLPHEQYPNPYITPELCFRFHYFALRKMHFMMRAKALVAFPGAKHLILTICWTKVLLISRIVIYSGMPRQQTIFGKVCYAGMRKMVKY